MTDFPYPKAAARIRQEAPDEELLWMGSTQVRALIPIMAILIFIGAFMTGFSMLWLSVWERSMGAMPDWIRIPAEFIGGEVSFLMLIGVLVMLSGPIIMLLSSGTTYAITSGHLWITSRSGRFKPFSYPLNNVKDIKISNLNKRGVGDVTFVFEEPIQHGKMVKRRQVFTSVKDAEALKRMMMERLTDGIDD